MYSVLRAIIHLLQCQVIRTHFDASSLAALNTVIRQIPFYTLYFFSFVFHFIFCSNYLLIYQHVVPFLHVMIIQLQNFSCIIYCTYCSGQQAFAGGKYQCRILVDLFNHVHKHLFPHRVYENDREGSSASMVATALNNI